MNTDTGKIYTPEQMAAYEKLMAKIPSQDDFSLSDYIQKHKPDPKGIAEKMLEIKRDKAIMEEIKKAKDDRNFMMMKLPPTPEQLHNGKVGRNDPCPCGSGVKFKKCHWTGRHYTIEEGGKK